MYYADYCVEHQAEVELARLERDEMRDERDWWRRAYLAAQAATDELLS